ncbi:MAG: phage tail protein [Carnobacterium inhibens]|uniref:phage tail protein n=1 Tax=Carnobacterium sp. TaxID=48221 RepID=UPI0033161D42
MYWLTLHDGPNDKEGTVIHNPFPKGAKTSVANGKLKTKGISTMTFTVNPFSPMWGRIKPYQTLIKVIDDQTDELAFNGRIFNLKQSMSSGSMFSETYECEDVLAYLYDTTQTYGRFQNISVFDLFKTIIDRHNAQAEPHKRFKVGNVTVTDPNDSLYRYLGYEKTYDTIKDKLLDRLGGYLVVRYEESGMYLDYLAEVGQVAEPTIQMRKNMKSLEKNIDPSGLVTVLIPKGATIDTDDEDTSASKPRVGIQSVNNGIEYIRDEELIAEFGEVKSSEPYYDDVNEPSILLTKARDFMDSQKAIKTTYNVSSLDYSLINGGIGQLKKGNWHYIDNPILAIDEPIQIAEIGIDFIDPRNPDLTLGEKQPTLTQYQKESNKRAVNIDNLQKIVDNQANSIFRLTESNIEIVDRYNEIQTSYNNLNTNLEIDDETGTSLALQNLKKAIDDLGGNIEDLPIYVPVTPVPGSPPGTMTPEDKAKLDQLKNYTEATHSQSGLFSASDKTKLDLVTVTSPVNLNDIVARLVALEQPE